MKKSKALLLLLCLATILLVGCSPQESTATIPIDSVNTKIDVNSPDLIAVKKRGLLRVGCKTDVPGLGYLNLTSKNIEGLEIDLAYFLAGKIFGVSFEEAKTKNLVEVIPVTTATRETFLNEDKIDYSIATFSITEDRKERFLFSEPYYSDAVGLMVKKDRSNEKSLGSTAIISVNHLDGKKVGLLAGATTRNDLMAYLAFNQMKISPLYFDYSSFSDLHQALLHGDIDVFAVDRTILNGYLDDNTAILPDRFGIQNYAIATKLGNIGLQTLANNVINDSLSSGALNDLLLKWQIN